MMKKCFLMLLLVSILMVATACASDDGNEEVVKAEYQGVAQGYIGDITVTVKTEDNIITEIKVEGVDETPEIGGKAIAAYNEDGFVDLIGVDAAAADASLVDTVSGATGTANGVRAALEIALDQVR